MSDSRLDDTRRLDALRAALAKRPTAPAPVAPSTALVPAVPAGSIVIERAPGVGGRLVRITEAGLDQIRHDRANGLTLHTIAKRLGIGNRTLDKLRQDDPRVEEALTVGHAACEDELVDIVMKKARHAESDRDSLIAAMFLLKSRHHYRDSGALDGAPTTMNVQVNNFDSMTTEEMRKRVAELIQLRERLLHEADTPQEDQQAQDAEIVEVDE